MAIDCISAFPLCTFELFLSKVWKIMGPFYGGFFKGASSIPRLPHPVALSGYSGTNIDFMPKKIGI
ncbi:hypothetical protein HI914_02954 [Erysiphe necator]|nr:hypothetical protein HI914_02954 [Erysiphe necator]